jgi:hypothetical protein
MVAVSLALHVCVIAAIALAYWHETAGSAVASPAMTTPANLVMSLQSGKTPSLLSRQTASPAPAAAIAALPSSAQSPAGSAPPNPAPYLNGADGVVFVLDISGSMYEPCAGSTRIALARQTLSRRIRALKDGTPFAAILYAGHARASGPLVAASDATREAAVRFIMRDVDCGGGANLPQGLAMAQLHPGALVLLSDGDLNISLNDLASKAGDILGPKGHGPGLTVIGIAPRSDVGDQYPLQYLAELQGGTYCAEQLEGNAELVTSARGPAKPASATP